MKKTIILDTNVILFDPKAIYKFGNDDVIIPIAVVEEVDTFKKDMSENGRNARQFSRSIDEMRSGGTLSKGVLLPGGGVLTIELGNYSTLPVELKLDKADNRILAMALYLQNQKPKNSVFLITQDTNLRIKADALGINSENYEISNIEPDSLYSGTRTIFLDSELVDEFYIEKKLHVNDCSFKANEYIVIRDKLNTNHTALARFSKELDCLVPVIRTRENIWGLSSKNSEQVFALDALLNDEIKLVSLVGKAGTGKTLLAIAAGLAKTADEGVYSRLLVSRPVFPMGKDIGFLPGTIEEKLNPWMQPIYDNIDFLLGKKGEIGKRNQGKGGGQDLINQGILQVEPLTYIRGRSIPQQFLIVDEAQNLTPHEIKTIITRAGDGTKIVLTGDSHQIDNPFIDSMNNGLVYLVDKFKNETISAHITLTKGERSKLSELASNLL